MDSACSFHICIDRDAFATYFPSSGTVLMGDDHPCSIHGVGTVRIRTSCGPIIRLRDVRYIPDMKCNLLSLSTLALQGFRYSAEKNDMRVYDGTNLIMQARLVGRMYVLEGDSVHGDAKTVSSPEQSVRLWHMRLGHMGKKGLNILVQRHLLPSMKATDLAFCEHCVKGKQTRAPFGVGRHSSMRVL